MVLPRLPGPSLHDPPAVGWKIPSRLLRSKVPRTQQSLTMIRRIASDHPGAAARLPDKPIRSSVANKGVKRSYSSNASCCYHPITLLSGLFLIGMAWTLTQMNQVIHSTGSTTDSHGESHPSAAGDALTPERLLEEFQHRYGMASTHMMTHGIESFTDSSIDATAHRLLDASWNKRPWVMAFAGYSVTVGRGNYFQQSFPMVLGRILEPMLRDTLQIPSVTVRNAAIGGIPSFPYGFCLQHFLGSDADVISWDYSMNEGNGAAVLEAYVRQAMAQLHHKRPMLIVLDTNRQRCQLLEQYVKQDYLKDAMCVGMAKDAVPAEFWDLPEEVMPPGLQHWQEFGAPAQCPGRGPWHPKKMEHEMIAWLMAVHFIKATQRAVQLQRDGYRPSARQGDEGKELVKFPSPLVSKLPQNEAAVTNLLYGHRLDSDENYVMKQVSCRTNFLPATDQDRVLSSVVVSGLAKDVTTENIMTERSDAAYHWGWVYDVSSLERDTKVKVEKCGGLGYIDMKIALYGIPESGTLRLWLPAKESRNIDEDDASLWFDTILICEANEKRPKEACQLDKDLEYTVGGIPVTSTKMVAGAAEYLKRQTCVHVGVPAAAKITRLKDVTPANGSRLSDDKRRQLGNDLEDNHVGIIVDVTAKAPVSRKNGACCVSHIVWEHH